MAQLDTSSGQIVFKQLGGLDERKAPYAQDGYDFQTLAGLYPSREGLLERIPGRRFLANVNGYAAADTNPNQVWNIFQPNDGSGNIIVQTNQDLRVYSLDELLDREPEQTIEFTNVSDEDGATMALIVHRETNGTNGGAIGAVDNVFYTRKLTDMLFNQSSTVSVFRPYTDPDDSQFDLVAGTYRIEVTCSFGCPTTTYSNLGSQIGLYNVDDARFEYYEGTTEPIVSVAGFLDSESNANGVLKLTCQFTIDATKTYEIRQAIKAAGGTAASNSTVAQGYISTVTTGSYPEYYTLIKILKMP